MGYLITASIVLVGVGLAGITPRHSAPAARSVIEVAVMANCTETDSSQVRPDAVTVLQGDEIEWTLSGEGADSFAVTPKTQGRWLYASGRHASARAAAAPGQVRAAIARAQGMRPNQRRGDRYRYNVTVYCGTDSHVIDPDIIIGP